VLAQYQVSPQAASCAFPLRAAPFQAFARAAAAPACGAKSKEKDEFE